MDTRLEQNPPEIHQKDVTDFLRDLDQTSNNEVYLCTLPECQLLHQNKFFINLMLQEKLKIVHITEKKEN